MDKVLIGKETMEEDTRENVVQEKAVIDKRVVLSKSTYKKLNIIKTLLDDDITAGLQEKEALGLIIDKAVAYYFKSDEIQDIMDKI